MKALLSKFRYGAAISLISMSASLTAVEDVLNTPSVKSDIAINSLLLDVGYAGDRLVAVGVRGHILYSDDNGQSWEQANVPVSVLLTSVNFADRKNGWAVGHSGVILKTSDGGSNWVKQFDGDQANKMIITQSEKVLEDMKLELADAPEEELEDLEYEVEEAAFAVEDARLDATVGASKPLLDVLFSSDKDGFVVGAYGFMFKTTDGGLSWDNYGDRMDNPDRFHLNAINKIKGGALLAVGEAGVIYRSTDDGESWDVLDSPYSGSLFGVSGTNEENVVLVFGLRGNVYRSEDAGDTWSAIDSETQSTLMSAATSTGDGISIVGTSGSVLLSEDGGKTFTETIRKDRLSNASAIYIHSSKVVMVGESGVVLTNPSGMSL